MAAPAPRTTAPAKAPPPRGGRSAPGAGVGGRRGPMSAPAAAPAGPAVRLGANPATKDPRFQRLMDRLQGSAARTKQHPPAAQKAEEAQAAAKPPANEKLAGAKAQQVDVMKAADTKKKPEPTSFLEMLRAEIQKVMPEKVEGAADYMKGNDRQQLKGAMTGNINQQKDQASAGLRGASKQDPDPTRIQGKPVTPLPAQTPPPTPPAVGAADGMPAPKPEADVSLEQGKQEADQKLADAKVTPGQLQEANDPRFTAVLDARGAVYNQADEGPRKYRADEQKNLSQAAAQAVAGERQGLGALRAAKGRSLTGVRAHQLTAQERDEARRKKVTDHIEEIYTRTKESVDKKLASLETDVGDLFDKEADAAIKRMKEYVEDRFDERYSGWWGWKRWLQDKFLWLPPKVKAWFDEAHAIFLEDLDKLVVRIAALVEQRLKEAKDEISSAQKEIKTYVDGLDPDLKQVGREAEKNVADQFNDLRRAVDDKKNDLVQSLAQRYKDAHDKGEAALKELRDAHKNLIQKLVDKLAEIWEILTNFKNRIMSMLSKARDAIDIIVAHPIRFLENLLDAIGRGVNQFVKNIDKHIKEQFLNWLVGTLADAGITVPTDFSLGSIFKLVLQVLGLTPDRIRAKAVRLIGERNMMLFEKAWALIHALITGGPAALWEQVKEFTGDLVDALLGEIQKWVVTSLIEAAVVKLLSMFNPVGAIIQAIMMIYRTVMFFIENIDRILDFVQAIIDSVYKIATGDIASAANWIETALARTIPIIIDFLARLIPLSGVAHTIVGFIKKVRDTVDTAIDMLIGKVVGGVKKLLRGGKDEKGGDVREQAGTPRGDIGKTLEFTADGEPHRLWILRSGQRAVVMMASEEKPAARHLQDLNRMAQALGGDDRTALQAEVTQASQADADLTAEASAAASSSQPNAPHAAEIGVETAEEREAGKIKRALETAAGKRFEAFRKSSRYAPKSVEKPVFAPVNNRGTPYHVSSEHWWRFDQYKTFLQSLGQKLSDRQITRDLTHAWDNARISQVGSATANTYTIVEPPPPYSPVVVDLEAEAANPDLQAAVEAAGGIVQFMIAMAQGRSVRGGSTEFTRSGLDAVWRSQSNREWLSRRFRGVQPGFHEWIPTDLMIDVINRAAESPSQGIEAARWINLQNELRTDTSWVIFKPSRATQEEDPITHRTYAVLQGHAGALSYEYAGRRITASVGEPAFHSALRKAFGRGKTVAQALIELEQVFKAWVWDGTEALPANLNPTMADDTGALIAANSGAVASRQAARFKATETMFANLRTKYG